MNHKPNALQRFLHRFLMLKPVSVLMARILQPVDEFARLLTRGKHTITELVGLPVIELDTSVRTRDCAARIRWLAFARGRRSLSSDRTSATNIIPLGCTISGRIPNVW